ncbi:MAG: DNA primase [Solirubrobacteraceae bacterium]
MSRYTADSRDRVKEAVDMVALVSARTELRRAGASEWVGLCPFHEERTPSFGVNADDKVYHCFGCQASGDAFTFLMETEGLDFTGALETLADRFGVQLQTEAEDPQAAARRQRRERLYTLLSRTAGYYARYLWDSDEAARAREYLLGRGLDEQTLQAFQVGYAPSAWDRVLTASRRAGFSEEELLAAGLAQRSHTAPGRVFDRFRERIMFPAADPRGRVLGFGARAMRDNQRPKYLNTADGELYHKRRVLFGVDRARASAAKLGRMILVEGYTDVLALHQAELTNSVGIMGTSFTEEQLAELERAVGQGGGLELCLDSDRAGQEAMLRAAGLAAGRSLELRVVPLPEGTDPADLIQQQGAEALRERVKRSVPFVVFDVERILDQADTGSAEGRDRAIAELAPALKLPATAGALREELLRKISNRLALSEGRLAALIEAAGSAQRSERPRPRQAVEMVDPAVRTERAFLVLCIALPQAGRRSLQAIDPEEHLTSVKLRRAARHLAGQTEMPLTGLDAHDEELAGVMADLVARAGRVREVTTEQLEQQRLLLERARLERAIRRAREQHTPGIGDLAREREHVLGEIRALDARIEKAV